MAKAIKRTIELAGQITSYICPPTLLRALRSMRNAFYTGYIHRRFAHVGNGAAFTWKLLNLQGAQFISIGEETICEAALQLTARQAGAKPPAISIGSHCLLRHGSHITATDSIVIGDHLLTGTNVIITDNAHGLTTREQLLVPPRQRPLISKGPVVIGRNVWLGNNVCVLPGVTIGDGVVVGANSVVTHSLPPYCVAAGIPARVIKQE